MNTAEKNIEHRKPGSWVTDCVIACYEIENPAALPDAIRVLRALADATGEDFNRVQDEAVRVLALLDGQEGVR